MTPNPIPAESEARRLAEEAKRELATLHIGEGSITAAIDRLAALASPAPEVAPQGLPAPVGVSDERIEALADWHCRILSNIEWNGRWAFDIKALLSFARALLAEAVLPPQGKDKALAAAPSGEKE